MVLVEGQAHETMGRGDRDIGEGGGKKPAEEVLAGHDLGLARQGGGQGKIPHHDDPEEGQEAVGEEAQKRGAAAAKQGAHQHQVKQGKQAGPQEGETLGGRVNPQMQHRGAHRQGHQGHPELPAWRFHGGCLKFDAVTQQEDQDNGRGVEDEPAGRG